LQRLSARAAPWWLLSSAPLLQRRRRLEGRYVVSKYRGGAPGPPTVMATVPRRTTATALLLLFPALLVATGAGAQTCARRDAPYPAPQLGTGRPPPDVATGANPAADYPTVYEGTVGDSGWDGKPGAGELVLLSPSLATWTYTRNLHNGALYTSSPGFQGAFPLGMTHPPFFQYNYTVSAAPPPAEAAAGACNVSANTSGGSSVTAPSFVYGVDEGGCCGCRNMTSAAANVFDMTGGRIYARTTGSGNWAATALRGYVNATTGEVVTAGPIFTGGSMGNTTRGRLFAMRRLASTAVTVAAPSAASRLAVHLKVTDGIYYAVELNGALISEWSRVSLSIKRSRSGRVVVLGGDHPTVERVTRRSHRGRATLTGPRPAAEVDDSHNEAVLAFDGGFAVVVRVYDDGFAVRFDLRLGGGRVFVVDEAIEFTFAKPGVAAYGSVGMADYAMFGDPYYSDGEDPIIPRRLDDVSPFSPEYNLINNPQLFRDEAGSFFLTAFDVLPVDYPRAFYLRTPSAALGFRTAFDRVHVRTPGALFWGRQSGGRRDYTATAKEPYIAHTAATRALPWRAYGVTTSAVAQAGLMLSLKLAPPPDPAVDYSFAPTHLRSLWDWGNYFLYRDPSSRNVTPEGLPTTRLYEAQAEYAEAAGVGYLTVDEGWNFPTREAFDAVKDRLDPAVVAQFNVTGEWQREGGNNMPFHSPFAPNFDMPAVVAAARRRGVGVLAWVVRYALMPGYYQTEAQVEATFQRAAAWGVAGLKIDSGAANDQLAVAAYHATARRCARYRLVCFWHGPSLHGESRTYPHFLAAESADTGESRKFGLGLGAPVQHMALPLLRAPLNPLDYQVGLTTTVPRSAATAARVAPLFWTWEEPLAANTRTHEAALAVLYWTGVTTLFDAYFRYADLAASADAGDRAFVHILTTAPGSWEETHWLSAAVPAELAYFADDVHRPWAAGAMPPARTAVREAAVVARRSGDTWWFAGVTGWAGYHGTVGGTTFLAPDTAYACTEVGDVGVVAGKPAAAYTAAEYQRMRVSRRRLRRGGEVPVVMAPAGGWVMECVPA